MGQEIPIYGDSTILTPNIDRLGKEGIIFSNAYVTSATCSSSRSSILTGLYPHQNGQIGLSHVGYSMHDNIPNLVSILREQNYKTALIGKLHVNPESQFQFDYQNEDAQHTRDIIFVQDELDEFINSISNNPFLALISFFDPHPPFIKTVNGFPVNPVQNSKIKPFKWQGIDRKDHLRNISGYYQGIQRVDAGLGMVNDILYKHGLINNTMIIFVGDHGAPFIRGKLSCYESGVKIPFIIRWPELIPASIRSNALISTLDILPTIMESIQLEIQENLPGKSLFTIFNNTVTDSIFRTNIFTEFNYHGRKDYFPSRTIRDQRYKLIWNIKYDIYSRRRQIWSDKSVIWASEDDYRDTPVYELFNRYINPPEYELYDLIDDPYEWVNLSNDSSYKDILNALQRKLYDWMKETNDYVGNVYLCKESSIYLSKEINHLVLYNPEKETIKRVTVYNDSGVMIYNNYLNQEIDFLRIPIHQKGLIIVQMIEDDQVVIKKIMIF